MNRNCGHSRTHFLLAPVVSACASGIFSSIVSFHNTTPQARAADSVPHGYLPLRYMGMNAILVFFWHGTATTLLNAVYWQGPSASDTKYALIGDGHKGSKFVSGFRDRVVCAAIHDHDGVMSKDSPCQLVFVLVRILCFCLATYMCARAGYFWKL